MNIRIVTECQIGIIEFQGENINKQFCSNLSPVYESPGHHFLWFSVTLASCKIFVRKIGTNCIRASYSACSWSVWEGCTDSDSSPHHLTAHICLFRMVRYMVRGINLLRWSPDWRKSTGLSASRSANSPRNGGQLQPRLPKPRLRTCFTHPTLEITYHIICESAPMTSRSLHTKLTF